MSPNPEPDTAPDTAPDTQSDNPVSITRRQLIIHDALIFLGLSLVTVLLFLVTLFLFRSFQAHRDDLATRWSDRGNAALQAGHPDQAIVALRTALTYAPGQRTYELLLAQALGDAGHTDESYNYFTSLWETQPGDGLINLRLARLAAKKNDRQAAINFYRASIYGTWEGDGAVRRRDVRLELARYLLSQHDNNAARAELLVAGGNNPGVPGFDRTLAAMLQQSNDPADALLFYQRALTEDPNDQTALEAAGRLEFAAGHFDDAHRLLARAVPQPEQTEQPNPAGITTLLESSERILQLRPSESLPPHERVDRILNARTLAKTRFDTCNSRLAADGSPSRLAGLTTAWSSKAATIPRSALLNDPEAQDAAVQLIYDTELQTSQVCGPPTGDDALLLLLAKSPKAQDGQQP